MSFQFDLNKDWVIDSGRLGNKTRFINHAGSEKEGINCEPKVVLVNGEHRIKFKATKAIQPGEELYFNYGEGFASKHGLGKKKPLQEKYTKTAKKTIVPGNDERASKPHATTSRGGKRPGAGRKATKVAPEPVRDEAVDDDEFLADVELDEDVEMMDASDEADDGTGRRPRRRNIVKKYTR